MTNDRAILTEPYLVYLAVHDVDVELPAGTEFALYAKTREGFIGMYTHPEYGDICVDTPHAVHVTPIMPGMFVLHGKKK